MSEQSIISTGGQAKEREDIGSFSFKYTNPAIQEELTRRSTSGKNVEVYMPSIRLTSTIFPGKIHPEYSRCKYFCIGTHGYPKNPLSDNSGTRSDQLLDIFNVTEGNYPIVGYTIHSTGLQGTAKLIRATQDESARNLSVPPPGIDELVISRNTNGRITKLHGKISVPSYAQYQLLFEYFLIPGVGILAEVANIYTNDSTTLQEPAPFIDLASDELESMLKINQNTQISVPFVPLENIVEKSVMSKGAYTAFFGRMANFKTTIKETTYEIDFECVGVGDASMGITMYEPFTKSNEEDRTSVNVANSTVEKWFVPNTENVLSPFYTLLLNILNETATQPNSPLAQKYGRHVNMFKLGDLKGFEYAAILKKISNDLSNVTSIVGGYENPIFISWPFFVNVILNDKILGIRQLYGSDEPHSLKFIHPLDEYKFGVSETNYDHANEPLIGSHGRLRSIDAKIMMLYNRRAQQCVRGDSSYANMVGDAEAMSAFDSKYTTTGDFHAFPEINAGTLSHGVWLNANNIVEVFRNSSTVHEALSTLLSQMSHATGNYWNLALDFDEHKLLDFVVVDLNFTNAKSRKLIEAYNKSYIFNKPLIIEPGKPIRYGSELISADIDVALKASLVATAVFAVQSGTHGHAGSQLSAFSAKKNVPLWELDITRFYNNKPDKPLDRSRLSSLDANILTKSSFSLVGTPLIIKPGVYKFTSLTQEKLDLQIAQYEGLINRDPYQIVLTDIQDEISRTAFISDPSRNPVTDWGLKVTTKKSPYADLTTPDDVRKKIEEITAAMGSSLDPLTQSGVKLFDMIPSADDPDTKARSAEARQKALEASAKLPAKFDSLSKSDQALYMKWINASAASTVSEKDINIARDEIGVLLQTKDALQNSPAGKMQQFTNNEKILTEQGLKLIHLKAIFGMIEMVPSYMAQKIEDSVKRDANNNFGFNGSLPIKSTITLAGIGGFRSGEIIRIARLPDPFTKAAFLILGTTDSITPAGWVTTLEAKYLPQTMFDTKRLENVKFDDSCGDPPKAVADPNKFNILGAYGVFKPDTPVGAGVLGAPTKTVCPALKEMIASGEGEYTSINRGRGDDTKYWSVEYRQSTDDRRLTEMPLVDLLKKMEARGPGGGTIRGTIFAAGKYQVVPDTLKEAIRKLNIPLSTLFNERTQELIGDYLLTSKRPRLAKYLTVCSFTDIDVAMLELAQEFASFPDPATGKSFYPGQSAAHTVAEVRAVLLNCKADGCPS